MKEKVSKFTYIRCWQYYTLLMTIYTLNTHCYLSKGYDLRKIIKSKLKSKFQIFTFFFWKTTKNKVHNGTHCIYIYIYYRSWVQASAGAETCGAPIYIQGKRFSVLWFVYLILCVEKKDGTMHWREIPRVSLISLYLFGQSIK